MERLLLWFLEGLAEGQGGPQAATRSAASGLRPLKPPGGRLGLRPEAGGLQKA